jgi:hypothetical protein
MPIFRALIFFLVAFHASLLWGRGYMKPVYPVSFEPLQTIPLAFWIAREYGPQALKSKPTKKEKAVSLLDQAFGIKPSDD